jgi:hypothetical protein
MRATAEARDDLAVRPPAGGGARQRLTPAAFAFRAAHATITAALLLAIAYVWSCALTGRRDRLLQDALACLTGESLLVLANRGDSPLGAYRNGSAAPSRFSS